MWTGHALYKESHTKGGTVVSYISTGYMLVILLLFRELIFTKNPNGNIENVLEKDLLSKENRQKVKVHE